ncbi:amino acid transporter [Trypanosoma cruzi]|nr:amino acid transporter [Trypanosoma cruzi]
MDFGRRVDGSILLMYDPLREPEVMVAYVGVLSKLCAYSLLFMACRNAIYHIIGWDADELPYWKHCIAVTILSTLFYFAACLSEDQTVLGFAGSITGGSLGFLLPALFAMYSGDWTWRKVGCVHYVCTYILLLSGVIGVVFGTGATIWAACG